MIILFDGVCNLCSGAVQWVLKGDPTGKFRFASLQSDFAHQLLEERGLGDHGLNSIVLVRDNKVFTHSDAVLHIAAEMNGAWPLMRILWIFPRFLRDAVYNFIGKNRYRWFGKKDQCWLPKPEWKERFL